MTKISDDERIFLSILADAGGRHRFGPEDKVTSEMHRMIRTLDRRGYISVEEENGITTVTLTGLGRQEAEHG